MEDKKIPAATPPVADGLFEKLKNYLLDNYSPANNWGSNCTTKTTSEIYQSFQALYPSSFYSIDDIAQLLHNAGFSFTDTTGDMKFEWILQPNN